MIIEIHMKSGKTLTQSGVKDYSIKYNNEQIVSIELRLYWWAKFSIIVGSLDLKQIEAVTKG